MSTQDAPDRGAARIDGPPPRILLIQAPYYAQVIAGMREGASRVLDEVGGTLDTVDVAGAFELPAALRMALLAPSLRWDGFLILGCVVRGETDHYTFICDAVCQGVMAIAASTGAAIGFGLLTVDTLQQAIARSSDDRHNKGAEAAHALLGQVALRRHWGL
jgi:6,7-dimethyl-8-ribityllumazine synthase